MGYTEAMFRSVNDPSNFTEDDARMILDHQFGNRTVMLNGASRVQCVGVIKAIEKLGGKYQPQWGITKMPNW